MNLQFNKYRGVLIQAARNPLILYFTLVGNAITFFGAFIFYRMERDINSQILGPWDAIWWAFVTVSTVGYGDIVPVTAGGRAVGFFLVLAGVTLFVGFTAIFATTVYALATEEFRKAEKVTDAEFRLIMQKLDSLSQKVEALSTSPSSHKKES